MRAHTDTFAEQQKATVERAQEELALKRARKVLADAARDVRIAGASVALTERDLEDMREGAGSFGAEGGLTKRCQNMLERAKYEFPNVVSQPAVKWKKGDSKFSAVGKGGQERAFERICVLFRDEERPWQAGARRRLREMGNEDDPDV